MVILNFGPSNFDRNSPSVSISERDSANQVIIPEHGELSECVLTPNECEEIAQAIPKIASVLDRPLVSINLQSRGQTKELWMIWLEERQEWVGIIYRHWLESMAWGDDESYSSAFVLNDICLKKIEQTQRKIDGQAIENEAGKN